MSDEAIGAGALPRSEGAIAQSARRRARAALRGIAQGELVIASAAGRECFAGAAPGPRASVRVLDERFWTALALRGALGGAEAYARGWWQADDLVAVVRVLARNGAALSALERGAAWLRPLLRLAHRLRDNDRAGSRRNISAHYDLGNDFFASFLDPTLTYSSAIFERPGATLEQAQLAKYERLCRKLGLGAQHRVLEIGSGWGGFALHAARTRGCRVTTTTISREQFALARERVACAGLSDRVEVLCEDYRDLRGSFDRLVSIEMIEAVGHRHLPRFFEVCAQRLAPDGVAALQAILVPESDWERSKRSVDFVKRHVFPGGQLVALGAISQAISGTSLRLTHYEDITPHYAETLRHWRERFLASRARVAQLGYSEGFQRTWEFYLAYCEGAFRERSNLTAQLVFENGAARRDALLGVLEDAARPAGIAA
jgi:cyclopropane-fatty-acyl-phospholipid synthase